ncbi:MAG: FliM/FliN family flagellar motor C-terminal domain-containing protein [Paracoccaceae bacterium]
MGDTGSNAVLRRKASAGRRQQEARLPSPARALRLGLARAAKDRLDLALSVAALTEQRLEQEAVLPALPAGALIVLLDGPGGAVGAAVLERDLLAGLIEQQTIGRVLSRPADPRPFTATDAAIAAPLLEGMLERMEETLGSQAGATGLGGFRFGAHIPEARVLGLALQAPHYRLFRLALDLAAGARGGELCLAFPWREAGPAARTSAPGRNAPKGLEQVALGVPAELVAVLHRMQLPLSRATALAPGDLLELPSEALETVMLEGPCGKPIARGRLGRIDGARAVRLSGGKALAPETPAAPGPDEPAPSPAPPATRALPEPPAMPSRPAGGPDPLPDLPPLEFDMPDVPFLPGAEA